jgi:DNA-binding MurR/RpiR family transcriptional regulator
MVYGNNKRKRGIRSRALTPLSSRIAHLLMLDLLAIGVAKKKSLKQKEHP